MTVSSILKRPSPAPELDSSQHLRTQFLRRIAHDIASPTGVTLTVLEELAASDRPRPELVAMAKRSLRRLMRLSEHLALVAELEAAPLEPDPTTLDVNATARQATDDAIAIDGRKDVVVSCKVANTAITTRGDARLLALVVRELIGNAIKLASSRVEVTVTRHEGHATICVEDDGPGFTDDALAALGKRFVPRGASRGLGLSLSMASDILGAHGGSFQVGPSSLPRGRRGTAGAAVTVTLPL